MIVDDAVSLIPKAYKLKNKLFGKKINQSQIQIYIHLHALL